MNIHTYVCKYIYVCVCICISQSETTSIYPEFIKIFVTQNDICACESVLEYILCLDLPEKKGLNQFLLRVLNLGKASYLFFKN